MNIDEFSSEEMQLIVYGIPFDDWKFKFDKGSPYESMSPVLLKGLRWREICVALRERRVILLPGAGLAPSHCGWLDPVKMWKVEKAFQTIAFDIYVGQLERLCSFTGQSIEGNVQARNSSGSEQKDKLVLDPEVAERFSNFLSDESLLQSTTWVAHQANNGSGD
ncbi:hypothetical protein [Caballeronia sordidicola]|uniref:hypothetical protein n=1 Tax=Caballeronia sordidicola TaxID=196367 RepID=UPI000A3856EE|nr:hypothetical protein [Caballeronia sordidicola]